MLKRKIFSALIAGLLLVASTGAISTAQTAYEVDAAAIGNTVTKEQLGSNILAPWDIVTEGGTYRARAVDVKSRLIRWPGGSLTEVQMQMDPATVENAQWETSLPEFLAYAKANALIPTIVIPAKRYSGNPALATAEVGNLVRRVTNDEFGTIAVPIWEIGNEFYVNESTQGTGNPASWGAALSYAEYGQIAAHIAGVIRANAKYPVKIAVQAGQNAAPSSDLAGKVSMLKSYLPPDSFDLLILHAYPNNFTNNNSTFMFRNMDNMKTLWGDKFKPYYISEWNVKNCRPPPYPNPDCNPDLGIHDLGMAQGTAMLDIFGSFVRVGTYAAAAWTVQRNNFTAFFPVEGAGSNTPYVGGKVFSWFSEVIGMQNIAVTSTGTANAAIQVLAFANADRVVIFVNNGKAGPQSTYLTLKNFPIGTYGARRLYYTSAVDDRVVPLETGAGVVKTGPASNVLRVPLAVYGPNEMIKITVNR